MVETTTIVIENTEPKMLPQKHMAKIINYCVENVEDAAGWLDTRADNEYESIAAWQQETARDDIANGFG